MKHDLNNAITFSVTTLERPHALARCLFFIRKAFAGRILVGDQTIQSRNQPNRKICEKFGAEHLFLGEDIGLSAARNRLYEQVQTRYTFSVDDDIELHKKFKLAAFADPYFRHSFDIFSPHLVSRTPTLCRWKGNLKIEHGKLIRYPRESYWRRRSDRVVCCDVFPPGAFLAKTAILLKHPFHEELKLCEGLEWLWRLKQSSVKCGQTFSIVAYHNQVPDKGVYRFYNLRARRKYYQGLADRIMGIKGRGSKYPALHNSQHDAT